MVIPDKNSCFISIVGFLSSGRSHAAASAPAVHNAIASSVTHVAGAEAVAATVTAVSDTRAELATSGIIGQEREVAIHTLAIALLTALLIFHDLFQF
jgi:hypothetical protein